jgi:hypothetical protein
MYGEAYIRKMVMHTRALAEGERALASNTRPRGFLKKKK